MNPKPRIIRRPKIRPMTSCATSRSDSASLAKSQDSIRTQTRARKNLKMLRTSLVKGSTPFQNRKSPRKVKMNKKCMVKSWIKPSKNWKMNFLKLWVQALIHRQNQFMLHQLPLQRKSSTYAIMSSSVRRSIHIASQLNKSKKWSRRF